MPVFLIILLVPEVSLLAEVERLRPDLVLVDMAHPQLHTAGRDVFGR